MKAWIGTKELEVGGKYLGLDLRDSNDILENTDALHQRLRDEGYLLIRGLHDREAILDARRAILEQVAADGALDPSAPLMDAVMNPSGQRLGGVQRELAKTPRLREVLESKRIFTFF